MPSIAKFAALLATVASFATQLSSVAAANANSPTVAVPLKPYVAVPAPGQDGGLAGTWQVQGLLYDQFRLNIWFNGYGGGGYSARLGWGKGTCNGTLSWYRTDGAAMTVQLDGSTCTDYSTVWTADRMICQTDNYGFNTRVAVPRPDYGSKLSCSYLPGSAEYPAAYVLLKRT